MKWIVEDMYGVSRAFHDVKSAKEYARSRAKEFGVDCYIYECRMIEFIKGAS